MALRWCLWANAVALCVVTPRGVSAAPCKVDASPHATIFQESVRLRESSVAVAGWFDGATREAVVSVMANECVLLSWRASADSERYLSIVSVWTSPSKQTAVVVAQLHDWNRLELDRTVVVSTDGVIATALLDVPWVGIALSPSAAGVDVLGAGLPKYVDMRGKLRSRSAREHSRKCPSSRNVPLGPDNLNVPVDIWVESDGAPSLYWAWGSDRMARVAFRHLLQRGGAAIEVVGIVGDVTTIIFLRLVPGGYCELNRWQESFGGNGTDLTPPTWARVGEATLMRTTVVHNYHHGVAEDEVRSDSAQLEFTIDGLRVTRAER